MKIHFLVHNNFLLVRLQFHTVDIVVDIVEGTVEGTVEDIEGIVEGIVVEDIVAGKMGEYILQFG